MKTLIGERIRLRALEPSDIDFLFAIENDESLWQVGSTLTPYSRYILKEYIANSHLDIYEVKQLRMVICEKEHWHPVGMVDLYDFDPKNKRVAIGIVIYPESEKRKGYASEAIKMVCDYAFNHLDVHQVHAGITEDNEASIQLFENAGFVRGGVKKAWTFRGNVYKDEYFYQLIRPDSIS